MEFTYKLHASQFRAYNDPARFLVVVAGRRFGKTILAIVKLIVEAAREGKRRVWYICPSYVQAKMIAWKLLLDVIPPVLIKKKNEVDLMITLINGSEIALKGADNEDSLRGAGLNYVVLDEYSGMKQNVWPEIIRPMLSDTLGKALFIGTPKGKNHFWELWIRGQRKENNFSSYQFKTEDNPYIARSEIQEAKDQLNERYFRQEYEASFEDYTGLIYPEFDQAIHVVEPFPVPDWYESVAAIDPAMTGTTASLLAKVDDSGNIFITNEYYEQNKRVSEVSESIKRWKPGMWLIDPAAKDKTINRMGDLYSLWDEYSDNGIHPLTAENDVDAGINRVAESFKNGKIKIFKNCLNLIWELERYHWAEERETVAGVMRPKPYKSNDHACDVLRYIVMSRVRESRKPKPRSTDPALPLAGELIESRSKSTYDEWMK